MFNYKLFFPLLIVPVFLSSCEKVIDVDVDPSDPVIVIEGVVANETDSLVVKITRSGLIKASQLTPISGASVSITEDGIRRLILTENQPGIYVIKNTHGNPGHTYTLNVALEGKTYTATCKMPEAVKIDTLGLSTANFFGDIRRSVSLQYKDPEETKNYYRCKVAVIKTTTSTVKELKELYLFDDTFGDGKTNTQEVFNLNRDFISKDRIAIELQNIDSVVYRYWYGISQNTFQGGASTIPANPVSNISNGALGYFSAHTQSRKSILIP
jgi:hypothetical protein